MRLRDIPLDIGTLGLEPGDAEPAMHLGRACLRFEEAFRSPTVPGLELRDGVVEADLAVPAARSFHGLRCS